MIDTILHTTHVGNYILILETTRQVMLDCVEVGVRGAIILSAGFKEVGIEGAKLEREVRDIAQRGKIRVVGPNCLGVQNPITGLNATFATASARPGNVAFISQSGAMCTSILDWSLQAHVGFSAFISTGSMMDVSWGDIIYYLGDDPNTKVSVVMCFFSFIFHHESDLVKS